jgi:sensor histidine kinase YesM
MLAKKEEKVVKKNSHTFRNKIFIAMVIAVVFPLLISFIINIYFKYTVIKSTELSKINIFLSSEAKYVEKLLYLGLFTANEISKNTAIYNYVNLKKPPSMEETYSFYESFRNTNINEPSSSYSKIVEFSENRFNKENIQIEIYSQNQYLVYSDFLHSFDQMDKNLYNRIYGTDGITLLLVDDNIQIVKKLFLTDETPPVVLRIIYKNDIFKRKYDEYLDKNGDLFLKFNNSITYLNNQKFYEKDTIDLKVPLEIYENVYVDANLCYSFSQKAIFSILAYQLFDFFIIFILVIIAMVLASYFYTKFATFKLYKIIENISFYSSAFLSNKNSEFDFIDSKIKDFNKKIFEEQVQKKILESRLLQESFNPHFLYNTLACLKYSNNDNINLVTVIDELVNFYRKSLNRGEVFLLLDYELEIVKSYIKIQNFAYEKNVSLNINSEPHLNKTKIIKLLIQPFVENAFLHGLLDRNDGIIDIKINSEYDTMVIEITDNGKGIPKQKIEDLLTGNSPDIGYGIKNTINKIKTIYGEEYGVKIESELNVGTKIIINIPINNN